MTGLEWNPNGHLLSARCQKHLGATVTLRVMLFENRILVQQCPAQIANRIKLVLFQPKHLLSCSNGHLFSWTAESEKRPA
ncbi:hypothetical protein TNCV_459771 [Trichonephila clavipes]|nr:hypothetical protein TNCV_459771 [Trichonephila clavipes]